MSVIRTDAARYDLINFYIRNRNYGSYLELGTCLGETFTRIRCPIKVGVDNGDYPFKQTYKMTTDEFFTRNAFKYDIIFVDAHHEESSVWTDIHGALGCLARGGVIVCHDCSPPNKRCEQPDMCWTAWRAFVKYRRMSPHLVFCYDGDWGLGVIDTTQPAKPEQSLVSLPDVLTYDVLEQRRQEILGLVQEVVLDVGD